jgi:cell wall-associated NlpC family hydrolase
VTNLGGSPGLQAGMRSAEELTRKRVVEVAREYIGTPYHHMGRVKGAGVDCATLLAEVYFEAGLLERPLEIDYYPMDWHLHRDEERYLKVVQQYCREISEADAQPGDVVVYHFGRAWAHGGIIVECSNHRDTEAQRNLMMIIHAVLNQNVQLADGINDGNIVGRKRRFFSPWAKLQD